MFSSSPPKRNSSSSLKRNSKRLKKHVVYLPNVLVSNILSRLSADPYLLRFRIVCKEWKFIIDDPVFAKPQHVDMFVIHTNKGELLSMPLRSLLTCSNTIQVKHRQYDIVHHNETYGSFHSCQGFLLNNPTEFQNILVLVNPLTKERLAEIPFPPLHYPGGIKIVPKISLASVGYDLVTNDYKVVIPSYNIYIDSIYSTKLGAWRRITNRRNCTIFHRGVFAYGALHWLAMLDGEDLIISLDLTSETYNNRLQLPEMSFHSYKNLYVLGGCLFLCAYVHALSIWILWILQDYEGDKASRWNEVLRLCDDDSELPFICEPVAYMKSTKLVLINFKDKLMWFDVKKKKHMKTITINGIKPNFCYSRVLTVSLDCLTGTCGADDQMELKIKTS